MMMTHPLSKSSGFFSGPGLNPSEPLFRSPVVQSSTDSANDTCTTASFSSDSSLSDYRNVTLIAVDMFEPIGVSPIPTDIRLVGIDDDSVDEFNTTSTETTCFNDTPCDVADRMIGTKTTSMTHKL